MRLLPMPAHIRPPLAVGVAALALLVLTAVPAVAHPLGNFTVNVAAGLRITPSAMEVDYVVDLAEVATAQALPFIDADGDGEESDDELAAYGEAGCRSFADGLHIQEADSPLGLRPGDVRAAVTSGEGGLPTLRLECQLTAERPAATGLRPITVEDGNFADRAGWREITARGDGVRLESSDVPIDSLSGRLTTYPQDRLADPPDVRAAGLTVRNQRSAGSAGAGSPGDGTTALAADGVGGAGTGLQGALDGAVRSALTTRGWAAAGPVAAAAVAALALGALHALAPGHGKAVIAAYLVGQRGSTGAAALLALSITVTHTAGVLVLGGLLATATATVPESLYPLLSGASGALIALLGAQMLLRARRARPGAAAGRATAAHGHTHPPLAAVADVAGLAGTAVRARDVVAFGFAGGLMPTPSALLVLLAALAMGRVELGVVLVALYGVGMAAALVSLGVVLVSSRGRLERRLDRIGSARLHSLTAALPALTAACVLLGGLGLVARAVVGA